MSFASRKITTSPPSKLRKIWSFEVGGATAVFVHCDNARGNSLLRANPQHPAACPFKPRPGAHLAGVLHHSRLELSPGRAHWTISSNGGNSNASLLSIIRGRIYLGASIPSVWSGKHVASHRPSPGRKPGARNGSGRQYHHFLRERRHVWHRFKNSIQMGSIRRGASESRECSSL